jgi:hypothetical protein
MNKREYRKAVKRARLVVGFIQISKRRKVGTRISKKGALLLIRHIPDDDQINAVWADDDQEILFVGTIKRYPVRKIGRIND